MNVGCHQPLCGMRHVLNFGEMTRRKSECTFGPYKDLRWLANDQVSVLPFQTNRQFEETAWILHFVSIRNIPAFSHPPFTPPAPPPLLGTSIEQLRQNNHEKHKKIVKGKKLTWSLLQTSPLWQSTLWAVRQVFDSLWLREQNRCIW